MTPSARKGLGIALLVGGVILGLWLYLRYVWFAGPLAWQRHGIEY